MKNNGIPSPYVGPNNTEEPVVTEDGYGRFNAKDIALLRAFKNKSLVTALVKVLQQSELTGEESELMISNFKGNVDLFKAVSKALKPESGESGLVVGSRWVDRKFSDVPTSEIKPVLLARIDSINFVEKGIERLKNIVESGNTSCYTAVVDMGMTLNYENESPEKIKRAAVAFQDTMIFLANHIGLIEQLAVMREETPEEKKNRLQKNSSR